MNSNNYEYKYIFDSDRELECDFEFSLEDTRFLIPKEQKLQEYDFSNVTALFIPLENRIIVNLGHTLWNSVIKELKNEELLIKALSMIITHETIHKTLTEVFYKDVIDYEDFLDFVDKRMDNKYVEHEEVICDIMSGLYFENNGDIK